ncbi:MAG: hypothetical protein Q9190_006596 [Brigantiaea leucoxantha]
MLKRLRAASGPLTKASTRAKSRLPSRESVKHRIDIVSQVLCDDALTRLAPSLTRHVGCTVIDIHPGRGLWSSKLHEILKPRSHILAEPLVKDYLPYLRPLLDQSESRYRLVDWEDKYLWNPGRYIEHGLLPGFELRQETASVPKERNDSLLIIANMAVPVQAKSSSASSILTRSLRKLQDHAIGVRDREGFHANGPVRLLMWLPKSEEDVTLPRTVEHRSQATLHLDASCLIEEIVTGETQHKTKQRLRDPSVEWESGRRVAERMRTENVYFPSNRRSQLQQRMHGASSLSPSNDLSSQTDEMSNVPARVWHEELQMLKDKFASGELVKFAPLPAPSKDTSNNHPGIPPKGQTSAEYQRMKSLENHLNAVKRRAEKIEELLQEQATLDSLALTSNNTTAPEPQRTSAARDLAKRKQTFRTHLNSSSKITRSQFELYSDDRKAFSLHPPLLTWDQRKSEPLVAKSEEFHPQKELCLLDIEAHHPNPFPLNSMQIVYFDLISATLLHRSTQTLSALDRLAPGAVQALAPKVPMLRDPSRGGEPELEDLRARCVSAEMVYRLALAWDEWPFKPDLADLWTITGRDFSRLEYQVL